MRPKLLFWGLVEQLDLSSERLQKREEGIRLSRLCLVELARIKWAGPSP